MPQYIRADNQFLIGIDVYDAVLVINSQKALDSFKTHKATLGGEIGIAAGPYGAGASVEAGMEKTPIWSYVKSKGMYAGIEVVGQVFVERFDENAAMYNWPGVKAGDIVSFLVRTKLTPSSQERQGYHMRRQNCIELYRTQRLVEHKLRTRSNLMVLKSFRTPTAR